ncbi:MAG: FAD-dependent oxidoreductase [Oscillospiraceae bacterium]|jgi:dihydrolipoamide dehydrogenase|nr:FAD-dependent oxidoreductase [Oscillospiraceae bacterium]
MFDLIVLGGGPAGYLAAERAGAAGMSVCLFEKRALGGVCLNEGCIPSKTLLHSAKLYDYTKTDKYGVTAPQAGYDHAAVIARKDRVVKANVAGIEAKLKKHGVTVVREAAALEGRAEGGFRVGGRVGRQVLLATGSEPVLPPIEGIEQALTNREILDVKTAPKTLAVIGGGIIGLEMASVFNSIGTKVTVYEMLDKIAGPMDREISKMLQKIYEKKGVTFVLGARVRSVGALGAEMTLCSVGRRAVTEGIGLETLGVATDRGAVVTDGQMRTNVPGVYAAGDCNGKSMLAHTAYREAETAVNTMLGRRDRMEYDAIPSVLYTNPEAAGCGETLETARAKGYEAREVKLSMRHSGRFVAENEGADGLCKLVLLGQRLLGVHMLGNPCSEIISTASLAMGREVPVEALKKIIFPHPTVGEILRETLFEA